MASRSCTVDPSPPSRCRSPSNSVRIYRARCERFFSLTFRCPTMPATQPQFLWTRISVGLYQITLVVQSPPAGVLPCIINLGDGANPFANVLSNLTVTLIGGTSFDGAQICVDTGTP